MYISRIKANYAAKYNQIHLLYRFINNGFLPTQEGANLAASSGNLAALKILALYDIYPDKYGMEWAVDGNHVNNVDWLWNITKLLPSQNCIDWAAKKGYLEIIIWASRHGIYPSRRGFELASRYDKLEILEYFIENNMEDKVYAIIDIVAGHGHLKILKLLAQKNKYPSQTGVDYAIEFDRLETAAWLCEIHIYPSKQSVDRVVKHGNIAMLNMLARYNIYP